jgi:adenine-specific DNA-methyltransferase
MAKSTTSKKRPVEQYDHKGKQRKNNPPVGLVDAKSDAGEGKKTYAYDPHLDPTLVWAGKAERTSFEIPTVSLHVHERIDPRAIIEAVRKKNGSDYAQLSLFGSKTENPPLREAIEFYKHAHNWSNRFIAGDSLLVMNSLLEKEGMAGQVQMLYFDPPYGITYGSNFQPFVNKRDVKDGKDDDLTAEPEMIKAFRDTWELGLHSYLSYLRDRLLLARELLHESGSVFVQISDENVHHVREILNEVFGPKNFVVTVALKKKGNQKSGLVSPVNDYILWIAKNIDAARKKFRPLFKAISPEELLDTYNLAELEDGSEISVAELGKRTETDYRRFPKKFFENFPKAKLFESKDLTAGGQRRTQSLKFAFRGVQYDPGLSKGNCWKHSVITDDGSIPGMERLAKNNRLFVGNNQLRVKRYSTDFPFVMVTNWWDEFGGATDRVYVVQTNPSVIERCLLMTTDPGDLVLDITCGSGTTAFVAEQWGRRWMTCDTSRVALTLAKQRLMTAVFDYLQLAHPDEGVDSGLRYKTVPHITSTTIANNEPPVPETLYDQPLVDTGKTRVTGPFTVEAVPAPMVKSPGELSGEETAAPMPADESVARSGVTIRQDEWRSELLRAGIRGKGGQMIHFSRVEPFSGTRWLHADAETKPNDEGVATLRDGAAKDRQRAVISFGPEHAPLEQKQVEMALEEARKLVPRPQLIVFAAFQFDPEAAKDIDETNWPGVTTLKAQMNADLLTEDLKKKRTSNESFWLIGQPDVMLRKSKTKPKDAKDKSELWEVEVKGFDYYNTKTGQIESGGSDKIAVWMLDTDYDGRSLFPRQVFFPMAGEKEGWSKLAKNLKAEIDESAIESYRGTVSLPFAPGKNGRVAVKIVDDRGIESLKIMEII